MSPLFSSSVLDEPYCTMQVLDLIKLNYKLHVSEQRKKETEKAQNRAKAKRGRGL